LLDNLLNDSLEQVADLAEAKDIKLRDESEISDIFVMANTRLLVRALVNLLFNAIKFAPTKSAIRVQSRAQHSLETSSTQVTITISNTVEANADAHDLVPLMLGFGLGLDFVDNVIHKHHGVIARNIPNNGVATVQVTLPCEISLAQTHHL
jgi:signal transduction histidine kinase